VAAALLSVSAAVRFDWGTIVLLLLLADPVWGSLWRLAAGRTEQLALPMPQGARNVWLPYLVSGSPAARLLGWDDRGMLHLLMRVALPSVLMAVALAAALGWSAIWLTILVLALSLGGWIARHNMKGVPDAFRSAVTIVLPWWLVLAQAGVAVADERWPTYVALIGLWFVHHWGEVRALRRVGDRGGVALLAVADVGLAVLLILARAPLWLALMAILWLPTWLLVYEGRPLQRARVWWLAALLVSGLALGQSG
jgi:hypothetical protein